MSKNIRDVSRPVHVSKKFHIALKLLASSRNQKLRDVSDEAVQSYIEKQIEDGTFPNVREALGQKDN